jgi:hypothetical protein
VSHRNTPAGRSALRAEYDAFAAAARAAAASASLDNVRNKHLMSAASWQHLADAGRQIEAIRTRPAGQRSDPAAEAI